MCYSFYAFSKSLQWLVIRYRVIVLTIVAKPIEIGSSSFYLHFGSKVNTSFKQGFYVAHLHFGICFHIVLNVWAVRSACLSEVMFAYTF